jgi:hypothetical protein
MFLKSLGRGIFLDVEGLIEDVTMILESFLRLFEKANRDVGERIG